MFRGAPFASEAEIISLIAEPTTWVLGQGNVTFIALANKTCPVRFTIRNEDPASNSYELDTVQTDSNYEAKFVWNGMLAGQLAPVGIYFVSAQTGNSSKDILLLVTSKPELDKKDSYTRTGPSNMVRRLTDPTPESCSGGGGKGGQGGGGGTYTRIGTPPPTSCFNPAQGGGSCFNFADGPEIVQDPTNFPRGFSGGDPVNTVSGNFVWQEADLSLNSHQPLTLVRTYNSLDTNQTILGRGWSSIITSRLEILASTVTFINPDGAPVIFDKAGNEFNGPP